MRTFSLVLIGMCMSIKMGHHFFYCSFDLNLILLNFILDYFNKKFSKKNLTIPTLQIRIIRIHKDMSFAKIVNAFLRLCRS